jgi:hypothetical protein
MAGARGKDVFPEGNGRGSGGLKTSTACGAGSAATWKATLKPGEKVETFLTQVVRTPNIEPVFHFE